MSLTTRGSCIMAIIIASTIAFIIAIIITVNVDIIPAIIVAITLITRIICSPRKQKTKKNIVHETGQKLWCARCVH